MLTRSGICVRQLHLKGERLIYLSEAVLYWITDVQTLNNMNYVKLSRAVAIIKYIYRLLGVLETWQYEVGKLGRRKEMFVNINFEKYCLCHTV